MTGEGGEENIGWGGGGNRRRRRKNFFSGGEKGKKHFICRKQKT